MRLFVVTPIYASTTSVTGTTPVVHYFTKEWVKLGAEVHVYHIRARFPRVFYLFSRIFQHKLNSLFGSLVPTEYPTNEDYEVDGVYVHRLAVNKIIPHSRYSKKTIKRIVSIIEDGFDKYGFPNCLIGHWHNPSLDIISEIKNSLAVRTCLVFHENSFMLDKYYGEGIKDALKAIDVIGFRNSVAQKNFISQYGLPKSSFIAYSGVSSFFISAGITHQPSFQNGVDSFVFVGSLIARKFPAAIIKALDSVYVKRPYSITFIGDGDEKQRIIDERVESSGGCIEFTGRIPRESIIQHLKRAQVFVMISRDEVFGLVYLEAMALGLIPIGSKDEGIDGIIIDGQNGFLCKAGDAVELSTIIHRLNKMTDEELLRLSKNAKNTAQHYSDTYVAKHYLQSIL